MTRIRCAATIMGRGIPAKAMEKAMDAEGMKAIHAEIILNRQKLS